MQSWPANLTCSSGEAKMQQDFVMWKSRDKCCDVNFTMQLCDVIFTRQKGCHHCYCLVKNYDVNVTLWRDFHLCGVKITSQHTIFFVMIEVPFSCVENIVLCAQSSSWCDMLSPSSTSYYWWEIDIALNKDQAPSNGFAYTTSKHWQCEFSANEWGFKIKPL